MIRVLTLADERYAMPLAVMGRSLLENHGSGRDLRMTVIDGGLTPVTRERVEQSWKDATAGPATWEWVRPQFGKARNLPVWGRVPALTYARLSLDSYFDLSVDRVILLDSDSLVLTDLTELQDADLAGNILGACVDPFIPTISAVDGLPRCVRNHLPTNTPYFNAGVVVADLQRWRAEQIGDRTLEYIERHHRHLRQYDQDALNAVVAGRWKVLDAAWNTQPRTPNALGKPLPAHPCIVHFSGRLKPWIYPGGTEWDRLFLDYLQRTEWRQFRVPDTWQGRLWKWYDSPARRLLHGVECRMLAWQRKLMQAGRR